MKPEICGDEFYHAIVDVVRRYRPMTILEIGSGEGRGSTQAFLEAMDKDATLVCLEVCAERHELLREVLAASGRRAVALRAASCSHGGFMTPADVRATMAIPEVKTRQYPVQTVLEWRDADLKTIAGLPTNGIALAKLTADCKNFGAVLVDGSAFTGTGDVLGIIGADIIFLDDTMDIKCWDAYGMLVGHRKYDLVSENRDLRNGYAIFIRKGVAPCDSDSPSH